MLELYKDVEDSYLTWIVTDGAVHGRWQETIEKAVESYKYALSPEAPIKYGEDPDIQDGCTFMASGDDINALRLEALLDE